MRNKLANGIAAYDTIASIQSFRVGKTLLPRLSSCTSWADENVQAVLGRGFIQPEDPRIRAALSDAMKKSEPLASSMERSAWIDGLSSSSASYVD